MPEAKHRSIPASRTLAVIACGCGRGGSDHDDGGGHAQFNAIRDGIGGALEAQDSEALILRMAQIIWQNSPIAADT